MTTKERRERERLAAAMRPVVAESLLTFPLLQAFTDGLIARHQVVPPKASRRKRVEPTSKIKETRR